MALYKFLFVFVLQETFIAAFIKCYFTCADGLDANLRRPAVTGASFSFTVAMVQYWVNKSNNDSEREPQADLDSKRTHGL